MCSPLCQTAQRLAKCQAGLLRRANGFEEAPTRVGSRALPCLAENKKNTMGEIPIQRIPNKRGRYCPVINTPAMNHNESRTSNAVAEGDAPQPVGMGAAL